MNVPFHMIRVRGIASSKPLHASPSSSRSSVDDERHDRIHMLASPSSSSSLINNDDAGANETRAHTIRVFAQVEGLEKQAIATHGARDEARDEAFFNREDACASACAYACERATTSAGAEDAYDLCNAACEDACVRPDAMGKFEITLRRGCEVTRVFEEALLERSRAERERDGGTLGRAKTTVEVSVARRRRRR